MEKPVTIFSRRSRNVTNLIGGIVSGAIALLPVGIFLRADSTELTAIIRLAMAFFFLAFGAASVWFVYALVFPYEKKVEISSGWLKWKSGRFPRSEGTLELKSVKSMVVHTDSEGFPSKITAALNSGGTAIIPFAWVIGSSAQEVIDALNTSRPGLTIKVS